MNAMRACVAWGLKEMMSINDVWRFTVADQKECG